METTPIKYVLHVCTYACTHCCPDNPRKFSREWQKMVKPRKFPPRKYPAICGMYMYDYFAMKDGLPNPKGSFCSQVSSRALALVNKEVNPVWPYFLHMRYHRCDISGI